MNSSDNNFEVDEVGSFMLTTIDNPFNPFIQLTEWQDFDHAMGYYTAELLARVVDPPPNLSDADIAYMIDEAQGRVIDLDPFKIYRRISKDGVMEPHPSEF